MCNECHHSPHDTRCPNAPCEIAVCSCRMCGADLCHGDTVYDLDSDFYCENCIESCKTTIESED